MDTKSLSIADIKIDGGTQIRAGIDSQVVTDYAEAMTAGAHFPPLVVFSDGSHYWLADGFHRFMAAQRLSFREFAADVRPGTKEDALWFALGANRTNGKRLTTVDKTHAIEMARVAWPEKMQSEIAEQVGCHPSLVSHVYMKYAKSTVSEPVLTGRQLRTHETKKTIATLLSEGRSSGQIAKKVGVSNSTIHAVRVEMGLARGVDKSRDAISERHNVLREMAEAGHTSRQMSAKVGLSEDRIKDIAKREGFDITADRVVGHIKRHDSNRIVERIVMDAENIVEGLNLVEFSSLDRERLTEWLHSLSESRDKLGAFIRRLMKEKQSNGEAA